MGEIDRAGNKVTLEGPWQAVDKLQGRWVSSVLVHLHRYREGFGPGHS
jgi:hypothetical protein